ncbi:MAG: 3-isopropylmalate dehydratase small subunit [Acidisphaera sp.]|nr:3-isopropylmalate dehydratase small subunit [Acidisphaera sp.]
MPLNVQLLQTGRIWKFGDDVNTDLIQPSAAFRLPEDEQHRMAFSSIRPDWIGRVRAGDILIAGANFGVGSGRRIGAFLRACGITGLVAESINGLGLRNCINFALPAIECPGVTSLFEEGETARIDFNLGKVENVTQGTSLVGRPLNDLFKEILLAGGIVEMLIRNGQIEPVPTNAQSQ